MICHLSLSHRCFLDHGIPSHPENAERLSSILQAYSTSKFSECLDLTIERMATKDELKQIHSEDYIQSVLDKEGIAASLDSETHMTKGSAKAATIAAGVGMELVERVIEAKVNNGFALLRPPGHHARTNSAMGFCIFNNIAIAAKKALSKGVKKILILDWDVHHGNGTQKSFYDDDRVLFIDLHQDNLFPVGSGAAKEVGKEKGLGFTINVPLNPGCRDVDYYYIFDNLVALAARRFQPELILVSAGFDAHESDSLGGMCLTTRGFGVLTSKVKALAEELCFGKIVFFLEGGYHPHFLAQNVMECVSVLAGNEAYSDFGHGAEPEMHELKAKVKELYDCHIQKTYS